MSCRRSFDIDLAAFLRAPRTRETADFLDHYPRCPACAAEVRAWTEVDLALAAPHPAPGLLLRHRDDELTGSERESVGRHVAACRTCTEELRTLERFERVARGAAVAPERRASPPGHVAEWVGRLLRGSGRLLWHPAFAYGVVLLLLMPFAVEIGRNVGAPRARHVAPPHQELERVAPADDRARATLPAPAAPAGSAAPAAGAKPAEPPRPQAMEREESRVDASRLAASETRNRLAAEPSAERLPAELLPRPDGNEQVLEIPLPATRSTLLEVRLRDATGTRELRQRFERPAGDTLTVRVPSVWLTRGRYDVEVRGHDAEEKSATRFTVMVR